MNLEELKTKLNELVEDEELKGKVNEALAEYEEGLEKPEETPEDPPKE